MSTLQIREALHQYINEADERFLQLVYGMMKADENIELSAAHKRILDKRLAKHRANPNGGSSWKEVKKRISEKL